MVTYKGLPAPIVCDFLSFEESRRHYAEGTEFVISRVELVGNTGTYLDSPFHRHRHGRDLAELRLESVAHLEAVVVRAVEREGRAIGPERFAGLDVRGKAVLVQTGWDAHWRTDRYLSGHPFLSGDSARFLRDQDVALVGIDSLNIDDTDDGRRPVHSTLLAADIPIVEHLCNLGVLPASGLRFFAVPAKVVAFGTWPVRAFAHVLPAD
ncbi:MAG TPA: cyclase family protein, partial [Gemmatimonadales bacterium]|nr:cyclase family protein [Gemmatimonadales bacterium]